MRSRQWGYGILEIALGIAVAALIIAGAMMYYQNVTWDRRAKETVELVMAVRSAVETLSNGQSSFTGVTKRVLVESRLLPAKFVSRTREGIRSHFGEYLEIHTSIDDGRNRLKIVIHGVPQQACRLVATKETGSAMFIVNNTDTAVRGETGSRHFTKGKAMAPSQAAEACNQTKKNVLAWEFY